jgi:myosin-5
MEEVVVWIPGDADEVWVEQRSTEAHRDPKLKNELPPNGLDDMAKLTHLHEPGMLRNLQLRCEKGLVYTTCGDVCISVNPYTRAVVWNGPSAGNAGQAQDGTIVPEPQPEDVGSQPPCSTQLYDRWVMEQYILAGALVGTLPPHIFAVAAQAYNAACQRQRNQSVIVSGDSGAGKTEAAKETVAFIVFASQLTKTRQAETERASVAETVLATNALLEATGNAKTSCNDNSSRFGKLLLLSVDPENGSITGGRIQTYMLEQPRVTMQATHERNYHIFYQVLSALPPEHARRFDLDGRVAEDFQILKCSGCTRIDGVDDKAQYNETLQSLGAIGATQEKIKELEETMLRCVAAVLHVSNIIFDGDADESAVAKASASTIASAAKCLQVETDAMISSLTKKEVYGTESFLGVAVATTCRDALARLIYAHMFDWVVENISECIGNSLSKVLFAEQQEGQQEGQTHTFVALLDLFGFEDFEPDSVNSLEQ